MAAVAVGVHVAGEHQVNAERIEGLHEVVADIADAACMARARLVFIVGDDILVHQDDVPGLFGRCGIVLEPEQLFLQETRLQAVELSDLRVEHDEVGGAVVERIVVAGEIPTAVIGDRKGCEIAARQVKLPVEAVALVIAHDGDERHVLRAAAREHGEKAVPVPRGLAVVGEVADISEK